MLVSTNCPVQSSSIRTYISTNTSPSPLSSPLLSPPLSSSLISPPPPQLFADINERALGSIPDDYIDYVEWSNALTPESMWELARKCREKGGTSLIGCCVVLCCAVHVLREGWYVFNRLLCCVVLCCVDTQLSLARKCRARLY